MKPMTKRGLENLINDLADELKKIPLGDPKHIRITKQLVTARQALKDLKAR